METKKAEPGTVSHGTLRVVDLVPTFWDKLVELESTLALPMEDFVLYERVRDADSDFDLSDDDLEHAQHLLATLCDALDAHAPEGHYFATHDGDSSDFGFWLDVDNYGECNSCGVVLPHNELQPVFERDHQDVYIQDGWLCTKHAYIKGDT